MTIETIINTIVMVAFFALSIDVILQIFHISKRKSSGDVSLKGSIVRLLAVTTFLIKFIFEGDLILIVGQAIFVLSYLVYFILLICYRKK